MAESIHDIPAGDRHRFLESMANGPAFALFCDKWDAGLAAIEAKIFDTATTDAETHDLKRTREYLIKNHHPRNIVLTMIRAAHSEKSQPAKK